MSMLPSHLSCREIFVCSYLPCNKAICVSKTVPTHTWYVFSLLLCVFVVYLFCVLGASDIIGDATSVCQQNDEYIRRYNLQFH